MRLIIASRKSDLARIQAYMVGAALIEKNSSLKIEYSFRSSLGDQNQDDPLWKMPSQGVFTQDFRNDLIQGKVDMVVHSWKDLPTKNDGSTILAATLPRADHKDLLLVKKTAIKSIKQQKAIKILSSSPRRMYNLEGFLKNAFPNGLNKVEFEDVRGNIQTRLDKLLSLDADGLIVAKAAIDRLLNADQFNQTNDNFDNSVLAIKKALDKCEFMVLPASHNPPAAAQGALVVEIAKKRSKELGKILATINCQQTFDDVKAEREILASHGGGCHQKIGVWVKTLKYGKITSVQGETDAGIKLKQFNLTHTNQFSKKISLKDIFHPNRYANMFLRQDILPSAKSLKKMANADVLLLASTHIPNDYLAEIEKQIIWASGVKSWFKLAAKNIWVNGVDDNFGSNEDRGLEILLDKSPSWLTLTHADSPSTPAIATYKLIPKNEQISIGDEEYFYWRSSSAFKRALELDPKIKDKNHACGLGQTYIILKEILGEGAKITPYLNEENWLEEISKCNI